MTQIQQIKQWNASTACGAVYEKLLHSIGTEEFGSTVRDSVMDVTAGVRRVYLFEAKGRMDTSLQYYSCEPGLTDLFPLYSKSYMQLDPIHDAYRATPACSDLAYQRIRPSDIASAGFRRRIFDDAGIIERVSIVQRGSDAWRALSVARHKSEGYFTDAELTLIFKSRAARHDGAPIFSEAGNSGDAAWRSGRFFRAAGDDGNIELRTIATGELGAACFLDEHREIVVAPKHRHHAGGFRIEHAGSGNGVGERFGFRRGSF